MTPPRLAAAKIRFVPRPSTFAPTQRHHPPNGDARLPRSSSTVTAAKVWLFTRNNQDSTDRFPLLVAELIALPTCIVDAELAAIDAAGVVDLSTLQPTVSRRQEDGLVLCAFDLLCGGGMDIRALPYVERKKPLARFFAILGK